MLVFSLLVVDFFDTMGTMTAVGEEAELNDDKASPRTRKRSSSSTPLAAVAGGLGGVSSNTSYIESASGVGDGARTGLASIVTGIAFSGDDVLRAACSSRPPRGGHACARARWPDDAALRGDLDWKDYRIAVPAFLTIVVMPFGYSIAAGIGVGFIAYVVINAFTGKAKEIKPLMWIASAAFVIYFAIPALQKLFGSSSSSVARGVVASLGRRPFCFARRCGTRPPRPRPASGLVG